MKSLAFALLPLVFYVSNVESFGYWSWVRGLETEAVPRYGSYLDFNANNEPGCLQYSATYYDEATKLAYMYGMWCCKYLLYHKH
jgi:hypothetical protein